MADGSSRVELILSLLIYYYSFLELSSSNLTLRLLILLEKLGLVYLKVSLLLKCGLKLIFKVIIKLEIILEAIANLSLIVNNFLLFIYLSYY